MDTISENNAPQDDQSNTESQVSGTDDSQLLDEVMEYLEGHIGALDMIHEALEEDRAQVSDEIPRTPAEALNSLTDNLIDKTLEIQAKRALQHSDDGDGVSKGTNTTIYDENN